ncbi:MAG: hypothetical protein ABIZ36_03065, partial [Gemmatimonadaceae bacterium]
MSIRNLRSLIVLGVTSSIAGCASMGTHAPAMSSPANVVVIHDDIAYLASDRLEGRLTGTAGNDSAAAYLARRYATLKLRQGSPGYLQKFVARSAADAHSGNTAG